MNILKDREFDSSGLVEVLLNVGFTILAIIIAIAFICLCAYHPVVIGVGFAGICVLALIYAGLKTAFDLIFPKKVDLEKRRKAISDWLNDAKNAFEEKEANEDKENE